MRSKKLKWLLFLFILNAVHATDPDFIIIGAQKSGTRALYAFLKRHPQIKVSRKEVHFFDNNYHKGIQWYRKQFPSKIRNNQLTGEASPYYIFHPFVPERVFKDYPNMKLIVILRNPVDRAYSQYWHNMRFGLEKRSFEEALLLEDQLLENELKKLEKNPLYHSLIYRDASYVRRGEYYTQLKKWFQYFPQDQFIIITNDELKHRPDETVNRVFAFLGLPPYHEKHYGSHNKNHPYPPMSPSTRATLVEHFQPLNKKLEKLLKRTFPWE